MKLRGRLQRLEQMAAVHGACPACRHRRGLTVTVISDQHDDGTVTEPEGLPAACERCGEIPERIIQIVVVVVSASAGDDRAEGLQAGESSVEVSGG